MRVDRGRLNWGVFFIVLGAVPLAYHQGLINSDTIGGLWHLWPLILVGIGLGLVLSRTPAFFVSGLFVAACLGLVFGSLFAVGPSFGCSGDRGVNGELAAAGSFDGISRVQLNIPCGHATITRSADSNWHVTTANNGGRDARVSGSGTTLSVRSNDRSDWLARRNWNEWTIQLPTTTVTSLRATTDAGDTTLGISGVSFSDVNFTLNAGSFEVNLAGSSLGSLSLTTNAGSARVALDGTSDIGSGDVTTNAGEMTLCVPAELGVQIKSTEVLAGSNLDETGLIKSGDTWRTQNYDGAQHKVNLNVTTNAGSFNVRIGGC